jgi:hypothetical protein
LQQDDRRVTSDTQESTPTETAPPARRRLLPWLLGVVAVVAVAVIAAAVVAARDDNRGSRQTSTQQLASVQQACAQWRSSYAGSSVPPSTWCNQMVGWMTDQARSGRMMGPMMFGNPARMLSACQQWSSAHGAATARGNAGAWCDQMVGWMSDHMREWNHHTGGWDGWGPGGMMNTPTTDR